MNNNKMLQTQLLPFPNQQRNVTEVGVNPSQTHLFRKVLTTDDMGAIYSRKNRGGYNYYSDEWDEIYPSLDVYYSLVDHGDFD